MLRKLEKYEILDEIGHGGMATVYRARDTRLERLVALKVMHPHLRAAPEARIRFAREARSVARLRHPNILEIYDYSGEDSEESYMAAELLTGPTLKQFAESHPEIPAEIAACFCIEIARALALAHDKGIVHRDVKPENVLLHEARCIKLTDFGIAQLVDSQSFTATGQILGSPGHMAPEQVEGGDCDERTDLFSLGTVLYYLAVGRLPFSGRNPHQVLRRIMEGDYVDPLRARPSIGGRLRAIIVKSLERDPTRRYQSAHELEKDLLAFVATIGIEDPTATLAEYLTDPKGAAADMKRRTIPALIAEGRRAADAGDATTALDHWNRVLALDDGNEEVLRLIEKLGRRDRARRTMTASGVALGVVGLAALGYAASMAIWSGTQSSADDIAPDAGASLVFEGSPADGAAASAVLRDAGVAIAQPRTDAGEARTLAARTNVRPTKERPIVTGGAPRLVLLRPRPQNVSIGIDGAEPRPWGPSFRQVELVPGPHRFRFVGGENCCEEVDTTIPIPPGEGPFVLERTLAFKPARLYVSSNVPADVRVEGGPRGRARELIPVPMEADSEAARRFTVTAPGHREYTGAVTLRAGQVSEVDVTLEAVGSGP